MTDIHARICEVLRDMEIQPMIFEDWTADTRVVGDQTQMRWFVTVRDIKSGKRVVLDSDWRPIRNGARSRVVGTGKSAALNVMVHELGEHFLYRGKRIFNDHADPERLLHACDDEDSGVMP